MTTPPLLEQALALPLEDRLTLAEALWQSIDADLPALNDRSAIGLATRRDADLTAGTIAGRTHEKLMGVSRRAMTGEICS